MRISILFTLAFFTLSAFAAAQIAEPGDYRMNAAYPFTPVDGGIFLHETGQGITRKAAATNVELKYFDDTLPVLQHRIPSILPGGRTSAILAQRFTLPEEVGTLDSINVFFNLKLLGKITVYIMQDTAIYLPGPQVTFHYPQYWTRYIPFDSAIVDNANIVAPGFHNIRLNAKQVSKEFHLVMQPHNDGSITGAFSVLSDSRLLVESDVNGNFVRMSFVYTNAFGAYPEMILQLDSASGKYIAPNMIAIAYVRVGAVGMEEQVAVPLGMKLLQNYPNPASVSTSEPAAVQFRLEQRSAVRLALYDALGREIRVLADEIVERGSHVRMVDVSGLKPGTYYYSLTAEGQSLSRKMLVVK